MYTYSGRGIAVLSVLFVLLFAGSMASCISAKKIVYFNDIPDTISAAQPYTISPVVKYTDPVILTNDILAITLQTINQSENNTPISSSTTALFNPLNGFLVDKNGNIELSLIGFVKVAGLTTSEARELIKDKAKEFFKEPVVNLRIANFEVELLGEFIHPGPVTFPSEKVNILEAISAGGDLSISGKRSNILLIRTEGDTKKFVRFNMLSSDIFRSDYFYLRQRDVLYVEPNRNKIQNSDNTILRNVGIISSLLSLGALVLAFSRK